jgi:hypothetical protein
MEMKELSCPTDDRGHVRHLFELEAPRCLCKKVAYVAPLPSMTRLATLSAEVERERPRYNGVEDLERFVHDLTEAEVLRRERDVMTLITAAVQSAGGKLWITDSDARTADARRLQCWRESGNGRTVLAIRRERPHL